MTITPFDNNYKIYKTDDINFELAIMIRTAQQINYLQQSRNLAAKSIAASQKNQVKRIEARLLSIKRELKPGFKLGEIVLLYKDNLSVSWAGKIETRWFEDRFCIHCYFQ